MGKRRKSLISVLLTMALLCALFPAGVSAAGGSFAVSLSASAEQAAPGEAVEISVDVTNSDSSVTKFSAFYATMTYNTELFTYNSGAEVNGYAVERASNGSGTGTLRIYRVGGDVTMTNAAELTLAFTATSSTTGDCAFTLTSAKVDVSSNAEQDAAWASITSATRTVKVETAAPVEIPVTRITLDKENLYLKEGKTAKLTATVLPTNATDKTVNWISLDTTVATVSDDGTVTAISEGSALIRVVAGGKETYCAVTVTPPVAGIILNQSSLDLAVGNAETLAATILPSGAAETEITWTSLDTSVATVSDGTVRAVSAGNTAIIAAADGKTAYCLVTVTSPVTAVALNKSSLSLTIGNSEALTATISPTSALNTTVSWTSSNTSVATVSNGVVRAIATGTAVITATAGGKTATCTVTVISATVTGVTLNKSSLSLTTGNTEALTATITPSAASGTTVYWTSSNTAVATVSNGVVRAVNAGTAVITATAGGRTATCTVTVTAATVTGITLNRSALNLVAGNSETLTATITPSSASGTTVTWTSSNTAVATVSGGRVTAVSAGTAVITATAGGRTATCTVTVTSTAVTSVTLNKTSLSLTAGYSETLTATILPSAASGAALNWTSSNVAVATVSNGVVRAIAAGTAVITAAAGNCIAVCTVTVTAAGNTAAAPGSTANTTVGLDSEGNKTTTTENTQTTANSDGSITETTTQSSTTNKPDGSVGVINIEEETRISSAPNGDGTVTETETTKGTSVETVTAANGDVTQINSQYDRETNVKPVTNPDGTQGLSTTTTETATAVKTEKDPNGGETVTVIESTASVQALTDKDGNGTVTERKEETAYSVYGTETTVTDTVTEISTDASGTRRSTASATATTTDANGITSTTTTVTVSAETADGTVGVQVSDGLGNTISGGVLFSDAAVEQAVRSGTALTSPVGYYAAPELEYAAEIDVAAPVTEGTAQLQLPVLNAMQSGKVNSGIVAYALVPSGASLTRSLNGAKSKTAADRVYQLIKNCYMTENGELVVGIAGDVELFLVDNRKTFNDVAKGSWYEDYVAFVTAREIFNGNGDGTFSPEDSMNRAMIAQVLYNYEENPKAGLGVSFTDVSAGDWFCDAVNWAAAQGIVNGYSASVYGALDNVTREQLVTMLYRYLKSKGYDMTVSGSLYEFNDASAVQDWAQEAMRWAVGIGLIEGTDGGRLDPGGNATRAQVATIMTRVVRWAAAR